MRRRAKGKIPKIKENLDKLWSLFIRRGGVCERCGSNRALQAAHIFTRKNLSTRWLPLNGLCLCYPCHIHWAHRSPVEFTEWVQFKLGKKDWDKLRKIARETYSETNLRVESEVERIAENLKIC